MKTPSLADYAEKNNVDNIRKLLAEDTNINEYEYDKTALHSACVSNAVSAASLLIEKGINVNLQDRITQAVPLHYCAVYNRYEIASLILSNGGKLNIVDKYGNEPLWTAVFNVRKDLTGLSLVELFLKHGANKNHKNNAGRSPLDFANQVKFGPLLDILNGVG